MHRVIILAKKYQVKVGAHPSYPDRENFGRISMELDAVRLIASIRNQIDSLTSILRKEEVDLHHIKPHGALYNDLVRNESLAKTFLEAIMGYREQVYLYVPYASAIEREALRRGFQIKYEAFADRNYNSDLSLVSRSNDNALIEDPEEVLQHLLYMIRDQQVRTANGEKVKILADTYCVHGDTPSALQILTYLSVQLPNHNTKIKK